MIIGVRTDPGERARKPLSDGTLWESTDACVPRVDEATDPRHRPEVTSTAPLLAPELARAVALQRDRLDLDLLARAYGLSAQAHRGQKRQSGDDYVSHSVAVATILAEQQMDSVTIAAALLHDVVEDSNVSVEDIRRTFGPEVAELVDGLTKLSTLTFRSTAEEQAENYRKLLLSVAKDARVIITGRPKNLWSIYKKMRKRGKPFEEIYDLLAVRVLVNTIPECYHVLGIIHHEWTPLQERIKDYIASPKSNGYQSLHTTVFGPGGQLYEIQIRTREMHHTAEYGIAAHWLFKEGKSPDELDRHLAWFRQLIELQQDAHTPEEFLEFLKVDLYQDEIFVFTPRGDVKRLPKGATPIDFAFAVHTEVGEHCQGARINGRIAPLHRPLKNGDTVEVITSPQAKPSRDWLAHVQTGRARHKIRQWIRQEEHERSLELGRDILVREVRRRRLEPPDAARLEQPAAVLSAEADGRGELRGQESEGGTFVVRLAVGGEDRRGLYADICTAINESGTNIKSAELATKDGAVFGTVLVEVENQTHLNKVIRAIRRLKGVTEVARRESGPQGQPPVG